MTFTSTTIKKLQALGLPPDMFDAVLQIMEEAKVSKPKRGGVADLAARGTRLPADWVLPRGWGEYGLALGLTTDEVRVEAEKFKNYWLATTGKNAVKLNWLSTWKNWAIKSAEQRGRRPNPAAFGDGKHEPRGPKAYDITTWERIVRIWRLTNHWHSDNGPAPGRLGCLVPPDLIK